MKEEIHIIAHIGSGKIPMAEIINNTPIKKTLRQVHQEPESIKLTPPPRVEYVLPIQKSGQELRRERRKLNKKN